MSINFLQKYKESQINLRVLNIRRGQLKAKLTRFDNFLSSVIDTEAIEQLEIRSEAIQNVITEFDHPQNKIELGSEEIDMEAFSQEQQNESESRDEQKLYLAPT